VEASKSLKQVFSGGPNFAAIEQSGQDQGRVHLSLDFFRKVLITKEVFQSSKRCRSRFDALVNVGVRGERVMDDRAQMFEAFAELYKSRTVDEEARAKPTRIRLPERLVRPNSRRQGGAEVVPEGGEGCGDDDAQTRLADAHIDGELNLAIDLEAAREWSQKAAERGNGYAQYQLGCAYEFGDLSHLANLV